MSGTSADAVDAALVDFSASFPHLIAKNRLALPQALQAKLHQLARPGFDEINQMVEIDKKLGELFAKAALQVLAKAQIDKASIQAIGSHGQTIRHAPYANYPFTLQIADPTIIAARTGIITVADFRRKDMALGGQGAPLAPAFHAAFYKNSQLDRIILNIGGMANITYLAANHHNRLIGFDTGPGNTLLDAWCMQHQQVAFDEGGQWARQGKIITELLTKLLTDNYFQLSYPKSTGKEYFNLVWLNVRNLQAYRPIDVQATLTELTAMTIAKAIQALTSQAEILLCGGGAYNSYLLERLTLALGNQYICKLIDELGLSADILEAVAFAWFAKKCLAKEPIDLTSVTGAKTKAILGGVYY